MLDKNHMLKRRDSTGADDLSATCILWICEGVDLSTFFCLHTRVNQNKTSVIFLNYVLFNKLFINSTINLTD